MDSEEKVVPTRVWLSILAAMIVVALVAVNVMDGENERDYLTPEELIQERENNEVAFERNYVNKRVRMGGEIQSVEERFSSGYRITMGSGIDTVDCNMGEESLPALQSLRKGQTILVVGTVKNSLFDFDLYDCEVSR